MHEVRLGAVSSVICRSIWRKAKRQLLSIFISSNRSVQSSYHTQYIKDEGNRNPAGSTLKSCRRHSRCFGTVPSPPFVDEISSSGFSIDTPREQLGSEQTGANISVANANVDSTSSAKDGHIPVMVEEVWACLEPKDNQVVVDMTFGAGGHARHILNTSPNVHYIAVDRDPLAYKFALKFAAQYKEGQVVPLLSRFSELPNHLKRIGVHPSTVDCFLMDVGVSSMQFNTPSRGFALSSNGPLDMRMDGLRFPNSLTAADVVNNLEARELAVILKKYGEERNAKAIAHAIVEARYAFGSFTHTKQLADVVKAVFDSKFNHDKLHRHSHVATKTFQALRIFVNDELNELNNGLEVAHHYLKPNGRCAVICFHSLEDRIVKRHFHGIDMDLSPNISIHSYERNSRSLLQNEEIKEKYLSQEWHPLRRKVLEPSCSEVMRNPRSRSAKLRAAVKIKEN